jgi:hypothetical protein
VSGPSHRGHRNEECAHPLSRSSHSSPESSGRSVPFDGRRRRSRLIRTETAGRSRASREASREAYPGVHRRNHGLRHGAPIDSARRQPRARVTTGELVRMVRRDRARLLRSGQRVQADGSMGVARSRRIHRQVSNGFSGLDPKLVWYARWHVRQVARPDRWCAGGADRAVAMLAPSTRLATRLEDSIMPLAHSGGCRPSSRFGSGPGFASARSVVAADPRGAGAASARSVSPVASLNPRLSSRIPFPIEAPISGTRRAPNKTSTITRIRMSLSTPNPSTGQSSIHVRNRRGWRPTSPRHQAVPTRRPMSRVLLAPRRMIGTIASKSPPKIAFAVASAPSIPRRPACACPNPSSRTM